jgi:hypothetical protein
MIVTIQVVGTRDMVDTTIKDVAEVAATTMKIVRAPEVITGVVVASEVGVEGTMMIVTIPERKKGTGAHHRGQDVVGLEVPQQVDMPEGDDGM